MANAADHLSAAELTDLGGGDERDGPRVRTHLHGCAACRHRRDDAIRFRELLVQTGKGERQPVRDVVPSAMMRLRLRRHGVTNANELLEGFVALVRGLTGLFSLPNDEKRVDVRQRDAKDETHG